jgi:putative transposase
MIAFIDDHRAIHGVELICKLLPIAPSTYHAHLAKRDDPAKLSDRARRDAALGIKVLRVFDANFCVYGVRKIVSIRRVPPCRPCAGPLLRALV